jgi:zinc protease
MKKSKFRKILFLFTVTLQFSFFIFHSPSHALDVKRDILENGLTLLVVERHNLPIVMVSIGMTAGSLVEPEEQAGLANLTAELLTAGTENRTASQINEEIDFVGASLGASGGIDYITVSLSVLKKDIHLGFDLLSDIIMRPLFPEEELNKKRDRIKGSLKAREEDPGFVSSREFKKSVFGAHPYGRLVSGIPETLDRIARRDIVRFHSQYYVPNNAIMSVVGDITYEEVKSLLKKYFSEWRTKKFSIPSRLRFEGKKQRNIITIEKDITQANIILGHMGVSRDNPDYYAVSVMNYILGGGGFASRLMQNLREERGLVYDVYSFFAADKYGGSFRVGLQTKNESANTAIQEIIEEIKKIRSSPVSDTELSDAQSFLTGSFPLRIETSGRIAGFLVAVEYYGLGMDYIEKYPLYINKITKNDVLRVAQKYLDPEKVTLVVVADQKKASIKKQFK